MLMPWAPRSILMRSDNADMIACAQEDPFVFFDDLCCAC